MSCDDNVCGTGLGTNQPKPGDPDNQISLSAKTVYGGISVSWSYPTINPHAVAHTIVYRGTNNTFEQAIEQAKVGGSIYFDSLDPPSNTEYWYWIQVRSVNGTLMDRIGPVSAIAKPRSVQTLETLTGLIDQGVLAQSLKTEIAQISLNTDHILQEAEARIAANESLAALIAHVQSGVDQAMTYVQQEITQRVSGDTAIVTMVNGIAAGVQNNTAAILTEASVRASADSAMASQITTLFSQTSANQAAIQLEQSTRSTADSAMASQIATLYTRTDANQAAIVNEQNTRATADSAMASQISTLSTQTASNSAAIITEQNARTAADSAQASQISGLTVRVTGVEGKANATAADLVTESNVRASADSTLSSQMVTAYTILDGNISGVQTSMQSQINATNGKVTSIGALYTVKVQVNGLVGGFGVYNDGTFVEAGFDVDRFWVGRTGPDKVKPFIIDNGIVYMDKARIRDADIDTFKIAGNSVMVGVYAAAYANDVASGGSTTLISRTLDLGDNFNSGLIVSAAVSCNASHNETVGFRIYINGQICGDQRASMRSGFGVLFPVSGFAVSQTRFVTVDLQAYSPGGGAVHIESSTMSIMGGKR